MSERVIVVALTSIAIVAVQLASAAPKAGDEMTIALPGGEKVEMIYCTPGSFVMGSPMNETARLDDETQHLVILTQGFWLGKYPITQAQWRSVMGCDYSNCHPGRNPPVDDISWDECQRFIEKVHAHNGLPVALPTEAQWEYACRAGTATPFSFGENLKGDFANCDGTEPYGITCEGGGRNMQWTSDVGWFGPNPWGFCDMHGNVWEWCQDWYGPYDGNATNPHGPSTGKFRVLRGGSWLDPARNCRSAIRNACRPDISDSHVGFRLACGEVTNRLDSTGIGVDPNEAESEKWYRCAAEQGEMSACILLDVKPPSVKKNASAD